MIIKVIKLKREKLRNADHPEPALSSFFPRLAHSLSLFFFFPSLLSLKLKIKSVKGKLNKLLSGLLT